MYHSSQSSPKAPKFCGAARPEVPKIHSGAEGPGTISFSVFPWVAVQKGAFAPWWENEGGAAGSQCRRDQPSQDLRRMLQPWGPRKLVCAAAINFFACPAWIRLLMSSNGTLAEDG